MGISQRAIRFIQQEAFCRWPAFQGLAKPLDLGFARDEEPWSSIPYHRFSGSFLHVHHANNGFYVPGVAVLDC
jgi:hypothetical protein